MQQDSERPAVGATANVTRTCGLINSEFERNAEADRVDDTSVQSDLRTFPNMRIDAVLEATAAVEWIVALGGLERDGAPLKWSDAEEVVLSQTERVGAQARCALAESCIIVITDPLELVRLVEINLADQLGQPTRFSEMLVVARRSGSAEMSFLRERELASQVTTAVARDVFDRSGAGYIADRVLSASGLDVMEGGDWPSSADALGWRPPKLKETVKLAAKASALVARSMLDGDRKPPADAVFWMYDGARYASHQLLQIGSRSLVVDGGDDATVRGLQAIQERAAAQASLSLGCSNLDGTGSIRTGNDATDLRLCGSDIGAGFARYLIANRGFVGLLDHLPRVLYNGRSLTTATAHRLDSQRARYRSLTAVGAL